MNPKKIAIFISLSCLVRDYKEIPKDIMDNSIIFAGSDRRWVFPANLKEIKDANRQPTKYGKFPEDFKQLILEKEKLGRVLWLKPSKNYAYISDLMSEMTNPLTGKKLNKLILDNDWWLNEYDPVNSSRYACGGRRVVINYLSGEHDYLPTMELLHQSNPNVVPVLTWHAGIEAEIKQDKNWSKIMTLKEQIESLYERGMSFFGKTKSK